MNGMRRLFKWSPIELGFFILYFYALQLVSDVQYRMVESGPMTPFLQILYVRFIALVLGFPAYAVYYKLIVPRFLFKRKLLLFFLVLVAFIVCYDWYMRLVDWVIYHVPFVSEEDKKYARRGWQRGWMMLFGRQSVYVTFMNLFSLAAMAYFIKSSNDEKTLLKLQQQKLQLELDNLKAQLNPHFFFNTLNNIYALARQKSEYTAETVSQLSELMRYVLYESDKAKVPLPNEVAFIRNYLRLEQIRHRETVLIRFDFQGDSNQIMIPPLLFVPFIENAFKHGLQECMQDGFVTMVIVVDNKELVFEISNTKAEQAGTMVSKGIGLPNVQKRLSLLYGDHYKLQITDNKNTYDVSLTLQLA